MLEARPILVRAFSSDDEAFIAFVAACVGGSAAAGLNELETAVQQRYPEAVAHQQDDLAALGGPQTVYVYRDGSAFPTSR